MIKRGSGKIREQASVLIGGVLYKLDAQGTDTVSIEPRPDAGFFISSRRPVHGVQGLALAKEYNLTVEE